MSVSYTHLDVYKRQLSANVARSVFGVGGADFVEQFGDFEVGSSVSLGGQLLDLSLIHI